MRPVCASGRPGAGGGERTGCHASGGGGAGACLGGVFVRTPMDAWLADRMAMPVEHLSPATVRRWQGELLHAVFRRAMQAPWYARALAGLKPPRSVAELADLPFTTPDDLRDHGDLLLRVADDEVARIVSLPTSGSTGTPKRLRFTEADLERTVDFFAVGMTTLCRPGDVVAVLMPGQRAASVGDLLVTALRRIGTRPVLLPAAAPGAGHAAGLAELEADVFVATPTQALAAASAVVQGGVRAPRPRACLLSAEPAGAELVDMVRTVFGCEVFDHWGMTETGYGGGVECAAHDGYHLREADILVEIVHPVTGAVLPEGETGEIVVTTLAAEAMPLLRYRTGDAARMLPSPCPCGSPLHRLGPVLGRIRRDAGQGFHIATVAKGERK